MIEQSKILYEDTDHQYIWLSWEDSEHPEHLVQSNQVLIINRDQGYLLDPGGAFIFSDVAAEINNFLALDNIRFLIATHQDPDVLSSVTLWLQSTPAQLYLSQLWLRFVSHYGLSDYDRIIPVPDQGMSLELPAGDRLRFLPAHFLHSEGNFSLYDERSQILFTGDIGASVFPTGDRYAEVSDWDHHQRYCEDFHQRYMANNRALRCWVATVRTLPVRMMVPQHGAIITSEHIPDFLAWLENLQCGTDLIDTFYFGNKTDNNKNN